MEPDPDAQWWTLNHAAEADQPAWYASFGARTPVELIAAFTDPAPARTHPRIRTNRSSRTRGSPALSGLTASCCPTKRPTCSAWEPRRSREPGSSPPPWARNESRCGRLASPNTPLHD
ncbi:DUF317 domain-containing protein [Streptomyces sp. NPDC057806]|uniref:DUF317 domain-containing protein n=1 Tax=Streptomyces sp. NPDC057806 TaxID=3346255 RepID=UPI00367F0E5F